MMKHYPPLPHACVQAVDAVLLGMRSDAAHHAQEQQTQTSHPRGPAQPAVTTRFVQRPDGQRVPVQVFNQPGELCPVYGRVGVHAFLRD